MIQLLTTQKHYNVLKIYYKSIKIIYDTANI